MPAPGKILSNPIVVSEMENIYIWALVVECENDATNPYKPITGLAGKDLVAKIYEGTTLITTVALDKEADTGFYFNSKPITGLRAGIYGVYLRYSLTDYTGFTTIHVSPAHTNAENYLDATISSRASQSSVDAIKAKTDNLPSDPASQSQVESAINHAEAIIRGADNDDLKTISDQLDNIDADTNAIKAQTDKIQFDASDNVEVRVNDPGVLNNLSISDVENAVHDADIRDHTTPNTFGWLLNQVFNIIRKLW